VDVPLRLLTQHSSCNCDTLNPVSHHVGVEDFVGYVLPSTLCVGGIVSSQAGGRDNNTVNKVPRRLAFFQRGKFEYWSSCKYLSNLGID
jgi:hypothetical protein